MSRRGGGRAQKFVPRVGGGAETEGRGLFRYPEDWKEEARRGVTLETRLPENPRPEELLARPDGEALRRELDALQSQLDALGKEREAKREEKRSRLAEMHSKTRGHSAICARGDRL